MSKLMRLFTLSVVSVFILFIGAILYLYIRSNLETKNMRLLAKQVDETGWEEYSYNIYSESVSSGFFKGEVWGPNGTYLNLSVMALDKELEESYFSQLNDMRVCINGFIKFVDFVESQTGEDDLTFTAALLRMDLAQESYKNDLKKGQSPKLPRDIFNKETKEMDTVESMDCKSELGLSIPKKIEKTIRYK